MPEPEKNNDDINDGGKKDEKGSELTLESLAAVMEADKVSQKELIESMAESTNGQIARLAQTVRDREEDISHLTNLLGKMAAPDDNPESDIDTSTVDGLNTAVDSRIAARDKADKEKATATEKAYNTEYVAAISEILGDEEELAPDGKPFSAEARRGLLDIIKADKGGVYSGNAVKDAYKNFKIANKVYYGLDKKHGFKGASVDGTGSGNGDRVVKRTVILTEAEKKQIKEVGMTEEWGLKVKEKKLEEKELATY